MNQSNTTVLSHKPLVTATNFYYIENDGSIKFGPNTELHGVFSRYITGENTGIYGLLNGLYGDITCLTGDISKLMGDATGVCGRCNNIVGNLDECFITPEERVECLDINTLLLGRKFNFTNIEDEDITTPVKQRPKCLKLIEDPYWFRGDEILPLPYKESLYGKNNTIYGDCTGVCGDFSNIFGVITGLIGDVSKIEGNVSYIHGVISGLYGNISRLSGDISGICGDATNFYGNCTGLTGNLNEYKPAISSTTGINVDELVKVMFKYSG